MGLKPLNDRARQERRLLESLAHIPTHGVSVEIVDDPQACCDRRGRVRLPKSLFQPGNERDLIITWRHELQHARDFLDCAACSATTAEDFERIKPRMEQRAERAERWSGLTVDYDNDSENILFCTVTLLALLEKCRASDGKPRASAHAAPPRAQPAQDVSLEINDHRRFGEEGEKQPLLQGDDHGYCQRSPTRFDGLRL